MNDRINEGLWISQRIKPRGGKGARTKLGRNGSYRLAPTYRAEAIERAKPGR
jgi:hypothetical protein